MKRIINGKRYDTKTAEFLAEYSSPHYTTDFQSWSEELYRKKTGEYFLYGSGNCASKYAEPCADGWGGGDKIIPLTENAAKKWVEEYANYAYEEIFEVHDDDDETTRVNLSLSPIQTTKLRALSKPGESFQDAIRRLVEEKRD